MAEDEQTTEEVSPSEHTATVQPEAVAAAQLQPGDRVGNYVIREQIGEGGFAIVYAAEQEKPVRCQARPIRLRRGAYHAQQATRQERN